MKKLTANQIDSLRERIENDIRNSDEPCWDGENETMQISPYSASTSIIDTLKAEGLIKEVVKKK